MEFSVQNLCGFLIRSKLMSPDGMKAMYQRWQAEAPGNLENLGQFTQWLIANKYVTEYQAGLLARGHADDFFLNQYMILERLGRGRMAGVYKAAHPLGQVVAIKALPPSRAKNPQVLGRFERESRLSLQLKHSNVVRSFQVGKAGEINYLVMEYLEGETLEEVLHRRKRLPPAEAVRLIHQALTGLQYLHEKGVVHRDLKPANLMLTPALAPGDPDTTFKATVKILDIGLARQMFEEAQTSPDNRIALTAEGVLLGTPDYLSPEQARDPRNIDIRTDIYALGCVLYHALTGQPPFPDANILSQIVRHATEPARPLKNFNAQIPDGLQQIVNWMMAKNPEERYPTPERAAQALQVFLLADNVPAQPIDAAPQMRSFLTWLEKNQGQAEPPSAPSPSAPTAAPMPAANPQAPPPALKPAPLPVAAALNPAPPPPKPPTDAQMPNAAPLPTSRTTPRPPHRKEKKHKRHKHRDRILQGAPAAASVPAGQAPTAASPGEFDVELVPAGANIATPDVKPAGFWPFASRDWLVLGIGAGAMLLFVAIAIVIVIFARS
jgi:serine/threonine protein kinase